MEYLYDVQYVYSRKWGEDAHRQTGYPLKLPSTTKVARLGHFPPASQARRLAGPVFYVNVFSLVAPRQKVLQPIVCSSSLVWSPKLGNDNGKTERQPTQTINLQHPTVNIRQTATNNNHRLRQPTVYSQYSTTNTWQPNKPHHRHAGTTNSQHQHLTTDTQQPTDD